MAKKKSEAGLPDFDEVARQRFQDAKEFSSNWRRNAREEFAFDAGDQWPDDDRRILEEQNRPPITFNYTSKMIDAIVGAEVSNRQEVHYYPREMGDVALNEIWSEAAKWVRDSCNAEDEESDAFRDALVCGMGWTRTRMDYEDDPDGKIAIDRIDPLEMFWDGAASKSGLSDRRYQFHQVWVDKTDAAGLWPNNFSWPELTESQGIGSIDVRHRYDDEKQDEAERHKDQVQILIYECIEKESYYRLKHPDTGEMASLSQKTFSDLKALIDQTDTPYVKQNKKVYYRAFMAGETILEKGLSPCQKGFTYNCITAKRDRNHNTWYGLVRVMRDPQQWANKWLSQILHIVNSNAKGGLLAETGAFVDPERAVDEWAQPDSVTLLNEGGLNRVREKQMSAYPSGLDRLMDFALNSLPQVTGINLEALGLANREQAGVLESQRKQAAYGILAPIFDALRRYRKNQGRVLLEFMQKFISDGRLVRINGQDSQQFIQLTHQPGADEYDIIVDQSPNAPDVKTKTWESLMQLVPAMLKAGIPIPPDLLDFTPLPQTLIMKWKQYVQQQKQSISPEQLQQMQQQMQQMQQQMQQVQQENQQLKTDKTIEAQRAMAEIQLKRDEFMQEMQLKQQEMVAELQMKRAEAEANMKLEAFKAGAEGAMGPDGNGELSLKVDTTDFADMVKLMMQSSQQTNAALAQMAAAMSRPKTVVRDASGHVVGLKPADNFH